MKTSLILKSVQLKANKDGDATISVTLKETMDPVMAKSVFDKLTGLIDDVLELSHSSVDN